MIVAAQPIALPLYPVVALRAGLGDHFGGIAGYRRLDCVGVAHGNSTCELGQCIDLHGGHRWVLCGQVDGLDGNRVVELKRRQYKLFGEARSYEKPQLLAYMELTGRQRAVLCEDFRGERLEHEVTFDPKEWDKIVGLVDAVVDRAHVTARPDVV